jgi:hypothetical protein
MTESMHRTLVVTKLPKSVPTLLGLVRVFLTAMEGNPYFPAPTPGLDAVALVLAELDEAQTAMLSRTRGTREVRDAKRAALVVLLRGLRGYVQSVADRDPDSAASIIESAGMNVKRPAVQTKPPFAVKPGRVSGSVQLVARAAGDRVFYEWQWSTDGGVTWHDAPATMQAKTRLAGLPVGKTCWFRVRAVTKEGGQEWSQAVAWMVT